MEAFPKEGMRKLAFYTQEENLDEFFLGIDNNAFSKKEMDKLITKNKVVDILQRIPLDKNQWPWIDKEGFLYIADSKNPESDKKKIGVYDYVLKNFYSDIEEKSM